MDERGMQRKGGNLMGDPEGSPFPAPKQRSLVAECGLVGRVADTKTS